MNVGRPSDDCRPSPTIRTLGPFVANRRRARPFSNRRAKEATCRLSNTLEISTLATIWDRLAEADLEGRYYFSDLPFLSLWGAKYAALGRPFASFLADAAAGTLPHVSFVEPRFLGEQAGLSNDDHPFSDVRNGQAFMNLVYSALITCPVWESTVLVINYDEWGGFFDHVPPITAPTPPADQAAGNQDGLLGFRTPCLVISPFAAKGRVNSLDLDHTSVLKMIEWRWGLQPLTVRDATANNLAEVLDFSEIQDNPKPFKVAEGPFGQLCAPGIPDVTDEEWRPLLEIAASFGWPVGVPA